MEAVFWISLSVLFYAYLGYGLLLSFIRLLAKKENRFKETYLPPVSVVVPAYNEEAFIEQKIQNCLSLNYPQHLLSLIFITDGSTDHTPLLVDQHDTIQHLHQPDRRGKTAALNRAMQQVTTPVVVFTDANTTLHPDSIQKIVRHYQDEKIGGVSGE